MLAKVENTDLVRDLNSKAILVTDINKYREYKKRRAYEERILNLERKLEKLMEIHGVSD